MTFIRMLIAVIMAVALNHAENPVQFSIVIAAAFSAWSFTTDPLPAAIDRGLESFKKRYQR